MTVTQDWQSLAAAKRASVLAKIPSAWRLPEATLKGINEESEQSVLEVPQTCGLLTEPEVRITQDMDATELVAQLARGALRAQDVALAFCKRAAVAHQLVNCLTEIFFDEALERARQLDEYFAREGKPVGPLHGLPVSLKDSVNVKGIHSCCGYVSFLERPPAAANAAIVEVLLELGAVLYVKTNVPQTFMTADSHNHVFGRTLNPRRLRLTAGGSSGGEGALIALGGSPLGIGTDVGGSIRIPALCNGVVGYKPTAGRLPFGGGTLPGRAGSPCPIPVVLGPLARSLRDCEMLARAVCEADPWRWDEGAFAPPVWRAVPELRPPPLRLGLLVEDALRPLHPPMLRAMRTAAARLAAAGHTIVPLALENDDASSSSGSTTTTTTTTPPLPSLVATARLAWRLFSTDSAKTAFKHIAASGEPAIPSLAKTRFPEDDAWAASLDELWTLNTQRSAVARAWRATVAQQQLDAVLLPAYQAPAPRHDSYGTPPYTVLANVLEWPAVVVPFLRGREAEDRAFVREAVAYEPPYVPAEAEGLPCALQVLGRPMRDEELFAVVRGVEGALGGGRGEGGVVAC